MTRVSLAVSLSLFGVACFDIRIATPAAGDVRDAGSTAKPGAGNGGDEDASPAHDDGGMSTSGVHASCRTAPPALLPALYVDEQADGSPVFAVPGLSACDGAQLPVLCGPDNACPSDGLCVRTTASSEGGVCIGTSGKYPVTMRDGRCLVSLTASEKRALCCSGVEGVDCRAYPFVEKSGPGELCATHGDCEAGLVCQADRVAPVCTCPETTLDELVHSPSCASSSGPPAWGSVPAYEPDVSCREAPAVGWVIETLLDHDLTAARAAAEPSLLEARSRVAAVQDAAGRAHVLFAGPDGRLVKVTQGTAGFTRQTVAQLTLQDPLSLAALDVALGAEGEHVVVVADAEARYLSSRGAWSAEPVAEAADAAIALDLNGLPVIAHASGDVTVMRRENTGAFTLQATYASEATRPGLSVSVDASNEIRTVFAGDGGAVVLGRMNDGGVEAINLGIGTTPHYDAPHVAWDLGTPSGVEHGVIEADALATSETLYRAPTERVAREGTWPRVLSGAGKTYVLHRAPEGLVLRQARVGSSPLVISPDATATRASGFVDASGRVHVFYAVTTNTGVHHELRYAHFGTCPKTQVPVPTTPSFVP